MTVLILFTAEPIEDNSIQVLRQKVEETGKGNSFGVGLVFWKFSSQKHLPTICFWHISCTDHSRLGVMHRLSSWYSLEKSMHLGRMTHRSNSSWMWIILPVDVKQWWECSYTKMEETGAELGRGKIRKQIFQFCPHVGGSSNWKTSTNHYIGFTELHNNKLLEVGGSYRE